jgi:hypothetical protein
MNALNAPTAAELVAQIEGHPVSSGVWLVHAVSRKEVRDAFAGRAIQVHTTPNIDASDLEREDVARAFALGKQAELGATLAGKHVIVVRWPGELTGIESSEICFVDELILCGSSDAIARWPERIQGRARKFYSAQPPERFDPAVDGEELRLHVGPLIDVLVEGLRTALRLSVRKTIELRPPGGGPKQKIPAFVAAAWTLVESSTQLSTVEQLCCEGGRGLSPGGDVRRVVGALVVLRRPTLLQILLDPPSAEPWDPPRLILGTSAVANEVHAKIPGKVFQAYLRLMAPVASWFSEALDHHAEGLVALLPGEEARAVRLGLIGATTSAVKSWAVEMQRLAAVPGKAPSPEDAASAYREAFSVTRALEPAYVAFLRDRSGPAAKPADTGCWSRAQFLFECGAKKNDLEQWLQAKA